MATHTADRLERLFNTHKDAVYRQMIRVCNHREDAEDALAQAMLQALQSAATLEDDENFRGWLSTIGRRVCSKMRKNPKIQQAIDEAEQMGVLDEDGHEMEISMLKGCVKEAVDRLPETYRDVYTRCEILEEKVAEAADDLGISHAAAKTRLHRARLLVRDMLDHSICGEPI